MTREEAQRMDPEEAKLKAKRLAQEADELISKMELAHPHSQRYTELWNELTAVEQEQLVLTWAPGYGAW